MLTSNSFLPSEVLPLGRSKVVLEEIGQATLRYMIANLSIIKLYAGGGERLQGGGQLLVIGCQRGGKVAE